MDLDLKKVLISYSNEALKVGDEELTVGKAIANILASAKSKDPLRAHLLAKDFYTKEAIQLNKSDLEYVKDAVKENQMYTNIVTGQILELFS